MPKKRHPAEIAIAPGNGVDPIVYAWQRCNPRVPFPVSLRRDAGIVSRGLIAAGGSVAGG
jgi:hypothetical protein